MKKKIKVLIAEDEEINFLFLNEILIPDEFEVSHAWDGLEAFEMLKLNQPDIVLMDIKMPILNGFEAFAKIREINKSIPVVALTAYALSTDEKKINAAGFNYYLSKPVSEENVLKTIKVLLKKE